jgi:hypothetical protein
VLKPILREIRNREKGCNCSTQPWQRFELDENGYKTLQQLLKDDGYAADKLRYNSGNKSLVLDSLILKYRYDYFPSINQLVLRMPTVLHESVSSEVVMEILRQLNSIASYVVASAKFARNIMPTGSGEVIFPDPEYGKHPQLGQTSLRGAGDQYLNLVTSRKLRSVHTGGGEFRSVVVGVSSPNARRDFHRPHPGGSQPFSSWSKPPLDGWETGTCVGKYARTCRNGRGTLQDHLRRCGGGQLRETRPPSFLVSLE